DREAKRAHTVRSHRSLSAWVAAVAAATRYRGRGAKQSGRRGDGGETFVVSRRRARLRRQLQRGSASAAAPRIWVADGVSARYERVSVDNVYCGEVAC